MEKTEFAQITAAILLMFVVSGVGFALAGETAGLVQVFVYSIVVVGVPIVAKNATAYAFDSSVTHEIWNVYHFGFRPKEHFRKPRPAGLIIPLLFSLLSLGIFKVMTFLTYETRALKHRAAKRFGFYSYTSTTDWHNGLIGASGVIVLLIIAVVGYLPGWELLSKMATYYAFWNMVPISKLDGTQIYFGNRILWSVLGALTLVFLLYAFWL